MGQQFQPEPESEPETETEPEPRPRPEPEPELEPEPKLEPETEPKPEPEPRQEPEPRPESPSRAELILPDFKNMPDACVSLNNADSKLPEAVSKAGCAALFGQRTKVWCEIES